MTEYCSVKEIAKKFGISNRRVQILCEQKRIDGATRISGVWLIPKEAKKPADARLQPKKSKRNQSRLLSLKEACELLGISQATGRNWIKSGKLVAQNGQTGKYRFLKADIEKMKRDFLSGKEDKLKSRRNKKYISGIQTYQGYIEEASSFSIVTQLAELYQQGNQNANQLKLILAEYALQLLCSAKGITTSQTNQLLALYCKKELDVGTYQPLIEDLLKDIPNRMDLINQYASLFNFTLPYVKGQDSLGLLYLSLRSMNERKETGAYYTPIAVVRTVVDGLVSENLLDTTKTVFDPCCGTGNFLIYVSQFQSDVTQIFGQDLDEISIQIARINLCLACETSDIDVLYQNIICVDSLKKEQEKSYDIIIGNPPWGYRYTAAYIQEISSQYKTISKNGTESFSLFLEHGLQQCGEDGIVSFVLPESLCMVKNHQPIREMILQQTKIYSIQYLGNIFCGVQCPAIVLTLVKGEDFTTQGIRVTTPTQSFQIETNRNMTSELFTFAITDTEYKILQTIESIQNVAFLKDNADFALGIVTGDNKKHLLQEQKNGSEPILKGLDVNLYQAKQAEQFIMFEAAQLQQVAKAELYRAKEKLFYRFICDRLVFAYDNQQTVSLNSCNIVIPRIDGLDMRYILAILNSNVIQFYFEKQFQSLKVLRSHIEQLPIPISSKQEQQYLIERVDAIRKESNQEKKVILHQEINQKVMHLFQLNHVQQDIINKSIIPVEKYL